MEDVNDRRVERLGSLAPGLKFRLFRRYRDRSPRPWWTYAGKALLTLDLTVLEVHPRYVLCDADGVSVPFDPGLRVLL